MPKVGCGKTVLFSSIVQSIRGTQHTVGSTSSSAHFYCLYRKGTQHDLALILRTFIAQLCPRDHIPDILEEFYDHHSSRFPPSVPLADELKDILHALVGKPEQAPGHFSKDERHQSEPKYLLIDALDELPWGSSRDSIITYLDELAGMCIPNLHILATSRNEYDIRARLHSWPSTLAIDKQKVAEDIRLYVTSQINKHQEMSRQKEAIKELIIRRLVDEGNGM